MRDGGASRGAGPEPAGWTRAMRGSALQEMLELTARPDLISLALGLPAADLFPTEGIGKALAAVLGADARALQYGPPSGNLRAFVAGLMRRRGVACEPEQIFLTAGAQQAMSLVARLLLDPGDTVLLEEHCYTGFQQAIASSTPRTVTVPASLDTGIDVESAERAIASGPRPSLVYAMSDGHNPLGVSMPLDARRRLAALARSSGVPVIEDDAYGMISYDGMELPAIRSFDADWVFYLGSFSKTLAPALRTGWVVVPERFLAPLAALKESTDINTATLGQRAVAAFVEAGGFDDHVETLRRAYAARRDAMLEAIERDFPRGSRWSVPRAGFFTWVELPGGLDTVRLLAAAVEREKVAFLPGAAFAAGDAAPARSALRLNFSFHRPAEIRDGVARIARAIEAQARSESAGAAHG